ncbi:MAG: cytochrome c biogenesis protein CcsA [Gammaproteobacteria bacterium]
MLLSITGIICYLLSTAFIGLRLRHVLRGAEPLAPYAVLGFWLIAWLAHGLNLYHLIVTGHGLNLRFFHALSLVAWLMAGLLLFSLRSRSLEPLGIVILPLAAVTMLLDQIFPEVRFTPEQSAIGLDVHIFVSLLAYSLLALAALQAVVLAVQDRHLHNHQPGGLIRLLPPLQHMEDLLFRMIGLGFVLLSLALLTGFYYLEDMFAQHVAHKTVLSIIAWLIFAVLLVGRWRFGWRGRTAVRWTLGGFLTLMLAYFGSKLVLEFILHR